MYYKRRADNKNNSKRINTQCTTLKANSRANGRRLACVERSGLEQNYYINWIWSEDEKTDQQLA